MVKKYKVLEEFDNTHKGQIFEYNEDRNVYEYNVTHDGDGTYCSVYTSLSPSICEDFAKAGFLEEVKEDIISNADLKIKALSALIKDLKKKYEIRNTKIQNKYDAGRMQTCAKVEHDTVYFNLMKLLNQFEKIVNE